MIAWLKGIILRLAEGSVVLNVNNVGYRVLVPENYLLNFALGQTVEFFIQQVIREDSQTLFGFKQESELVLFKNLISVSGIGPRTSLAIISRYEVDKIIGAVREGNDNLFRSVSGVGMKTAGRIILELKGKINKELLVLGKDSDSRGEAVSDLETVQALQSLGYGNFQINEALKNIPPDLDVGERVKLALQVLSGR